MKVRQAPSLAVDRVMICNSHGMSRDTSALVGVDVISIQKITCMDFDPLGNKAFGPTRFPKKFVMEELTGESSEEIQRPE